MRVLGVIPARFASTRFPGKPLFPLAGRPMIQWVYEAARRALPRVVVATDDRRILSFIQGLGGEAMMTSSRCRSGTDRVAEVSRRRKADIYLNIQGDEPLMSSRTVRAVLALHSRRGVCLGTAATALPDRAAWTNPDAVKVLVDNSGNALYFSRAPIPYYRDGVGAASGGPFRRRDFVLKHLGVYSYAAATLARFVRWPAGFFEKAEKLEQLR
ncbi:MAG TPA: 3-deoxy-manno-octulosonate cytidylyltransferase, partial [Elusimicrobiota bacterium]|nr:3-deoxy-manno-octulosonate cytidylyltransferase [Elusimicrobiota bacterium]